MLELYKVGSLVTKFDINVTFSTKNNYLKYLIEINAIL